MSHGFAPAPGRLAAAVAAYASRLTAAVARRRVVVWGAGRAGALAVAWLTGIGHRPSLVVDLDPRRHGETLDGIPVAPLEALSGPTQDFVLLASMHAGAMTATLMADGWRREDDFAVCPIGSIYRPEVGALLAALPDPPEWEAAPAPREAGRTRPVATVFASSGGNFYFRELQTFLVRGLQQAGWAVQAATELSAGCVGVPIVVGPHEFFSIGAGVEWLTAENLAAAVLVTTEQPQSLWFQAFRRAAALAAAVVDLSPAAVDAYAAHGIGARWLPLGWYDGCDPFDRVPARPPHADWGVDLPRGPLAPESDDGWDDRPIDVLFIGAHSPRRAALLEALQRSLPHARWLVHLPSDGRPIDGRTAGHLDSAIAVGLARRARILLNLHRDDVTYFEWQRIVWRGLWQRTLVVTEPCGTVPGLLPGRDYLERPVDELAATLQTLLGSGDRAAADLVRRTGHRQALAIEFAQTAACLAAAVDHAAHRTPPATRLDRRRRRA